jgi:ribosomal protein S18 acetylase RimI-like enzyme
VTPAGVRAATVDDAAAIARVGDLAWRTAYAPLMPAEVVAALDPAARAIWWRRALRGGAGRIRVLETDAGIAGFAHSGPARDTDLPAGAGELYALYLHPGLWRRGHGSVLLDAALADRRADGQAIVTLWVLADNARARAFYARHGFADDGGRKLHERSGLTEERWRRRLVA